MDRALLPSTRRRRLLAAAALLPVVRGVPAETASAYGLALRFVDDRGQPRELAEWRGRPVVITMAYGACRSVCTTTLRTLDALQAAADRRSIALDFVIASIDPAEDTPQAWADYRRARGLMRANWTFLSGTPAATRVLAHFLGIRVWRYDEHVMHDMRIVRLGPDGAPGASLDWQQRDVQRLL